MITTLYCLSERQSLHRLCSLYVDGDGDVCSRTRVCLRVSACAHMRYDCEYGYEYEYECECVCVLACKFFSQLFSSLFVKNFGCVYACVCLRCVVLLSKYIAIIQQHLCAFSFVSLHFACRIRPKNVSCELFKRIRKFLCNYRMMCWQKKLK